jgi:hypothetical protein
MSCTACTLAQKPDPANKITGLTQATYVRVNQANVLISGCSHHLKILLAAYNKGIDLQEELR